MGFRRIFFRVEKIWKIEERYKRRSLKKQVIEGVAREFIIEANIY